MRHGDPPIADELDTLQRQTQAIIDQRDPLMTTELYDSLKEVIAAIQKWKGDQKASRIPTPTDSPEQQALLNWIEHECPEPPQRLGVKLLKFFAQYPIGTRFTVKQIRQLSGDFLESRQVTPSLGCWYSCFPYALKSGPAGPPHHPNALAYWIEKR